jgi:uncharacterized protein (DUF924 family)
MIAYNNIIEFWFTEIDEAYWWKKDETFDDLIRSRFGDTLRAAAQGELLDWRRSPEWRLAEIIVLDQFSRNVYRNTPESFVQDPLALGLAQEAVASGTLDMLAPEQRAFLLMPYMHSESKMIHGLADPLFATHTPEMTRKFELKHRAIIDRFGRYPHRNNILGRTSTTEEIEFLKQDGSSF